MENIPDGTFRATVDGFIQILQASENPLKEARDLLESLQKSKSRADLDAIKESSQFAKFNTWVPNTVEKLAAYIAIIYTVVQLLTQQPDTNIEYSTFVSQYNQTINITLEKNRETNHPPQENQ